MKSIVATCLVLFGTVGTAWASAEGGSHLDLTSNWVGYASLVIFMVAYGFVMAEEYTHMRKSKPVLLAAGVIWGIIAWVYASHGFTHAAEAAVRHNILEYAELFLFLLVAMTYINAMEERLVFETLRNKIVCTGFSLRKIFWLTGFLAFIIYNSNKNHIMTLYKNEYWQNFKFDFIPILWYELKKLIWFLLFKPRVLKCLGEIWKNRKDLKVKKLKVKALRQKSGEEIRNFFI